MEEEKDVYGYAFRWRDDVEGYVFRKIFSCRESRRRHPDLKLLYARGMILLKDKRS